MTIGMTATTYATVRKDIEHLGLDVQYVHRLAVALSHRNGANVKQAIRVLGDKHVTFIVR